MYKTTHNASVNTICNKIHLTNNTATMIAMGYISIDKHHPDTNIYKRYKGKFSNVRS